MHRKTHNMKMGIGSIWLARSQLEQIQKKIMSDFPQNHLHTKLYRIQN